MLSDRNWIHCPTSPGIRSLIQTCKSCGANAFEYLTTLIQNRERLKENPSRWLSWDFKESLCATNSA
jgi:hypothetical protein